MANQPFVYSLPLVRSAVRLSKKIILPGFEGVPLYDVIVFYIEQVKKVGLNERAAAISFNFMMAIPAGSLFLFTLIPLLPVSDLINQEIIRFFQSLSPNKSTQQLIANYLRDINDVIQRPRNTLLSIGFLFAIFYSSNAVMGIIRTFNRSLNEIEDKRFWHDRWKAIKLTFIIFLLFIASMLILVSQGAVLKWIFHLLNIKSSSVKWLFVSLKWLVIIALFFYSIAFIYRHAPSVNKKWNLVSPGSIVACGLIILFTYLFSFYVNNFGAYNKIYGSIGTIMILMVLIFFNSLVLLIGFELNVSIRAIKHRADQRQIEEMNGNNSNT
jgi:membrane protein